MAEQVIMYCGHCGNTTGFEVRGKCVLDKSVEVDVEGGIEDVLKDVAEWHLLQCITCSKASLEYTHITAEYYNSWLDANGIEHVDGIDEKIILYPLAHTNLPNLPSAIEKEYQEALKVRNISHIACAVLARRTLEAVFTYENAQGESLMRKVDSLIKSDRIPPLFAEMAHLARKIGNMGAHFADSTVTGEDVDAMLDFVETILEYLYVLPAKVKAMRKRLDELP